MAGEDRFPARPRLGFGWESLIDRHGIYGLEIHHDKS